MTSGSKSNLASTLSSKLTCAKYHRLGVVARAGERESRARNARVNLIAATSFKGAFKLHDSDSKPQAHEHAAVHLCVTYFRTNKLYLKHLMVPVPGT